MKSFYLFFFLCLPGIQTQGQNLVPNPGFEEYKKIPCDIGIEGFKIDDFLEHWIQPTAGSTDYWSTLAQPICDNNPDRYCCFANPLSLDIGQTPRNGNHMTAIFTYADVYPNEYEEDREYLEVRLLSPLNIGSTYYVEMYVHSSPKTSSYFSNNLGFYFSKTEVRDTANFFGGILNFIPQYNHSQIVEVLNQWVKISGCIVAEEAYQYLLIGNFFDDTKTQSKKTSNNPSNPFAYYFIDDVYVAEAPYTLAGFDLGKDTVLCLGESLLLQPGSPDLVYRWQDSTTNPFYWVTESGKYTAEVKSGDCILKDSIQVNFLPNINFGTDTILCVGETLVLNAVHPINIYQWNDVSSDSTLWISQNGLYWVNIPSERCEIGDTLRVEFIDCPQFIPNVFTPNKDGINETFVIDNIENRKWKLEIYNRWGNLVYQQENYKNDWTAEGLSADIYYYLLSTPSLRRRIKGWIKLIK